MVVFQLASAPAVGVCAAMACSVVGSLYLVPARLRALPRDNPEHMRARMAAVTAATAACVAMLAAAGTYGEGGPGLWEWLGVRYEGLWLGAVLPLAHCACLFLGPLLLSALRLRHLRRHSDFGGDDAPPTPRSGAPLGALELLKQHTALGELLHERSLIQFRALVMGPVTEEIQFRACMLPLLLGAGWDTTQVIFLSPLLFGAAHMHHLYEFIRQGMNPVVAVAQVLFQFLYTSLFGFYEAFVFLRTGQLLPIILIHAFCNGMGLPDLSFLGPSHYLRRYKALLVGAYVVGIGLFSYLMYPATEPELYGSYTW